MDTELSEQFYRIQAVHRARKIPSVNYLWDKSTEVYGRVKGANTFVNWAFDTVESMVNVMIEKSLPVARLIEKPIYTLDKTLCQGIDFVEVKLPIIKEEPKQILNRTRSIVSERLRPAVKTFTDLTYETKQRVRIMTLLTYYKVHYLRVYSWQQADRVMSTETGINILKTVDNTTDFAEIMLDKYLPPPLEEPHHDTERLCSEHAKLHHTMERLSGFSIRASRRIYFALMDKFWNTYKIETLILILHGLAVVQAITLLEVIISSIFKLISDCLFSPLS
ncbi:lipid storage droplets surface-binding protein 2 [Harpegnathos saltator]|uniref:Lipid storage droplets surface-binding protein 2 n=1 Tax=Harpegnathos saltator TaxID=610380 RepID=E2BDR9_HARSA|nr:lipid storage droplets surface-binding protein 2 [Harpegnathos saltator]XP_011136936.1 lipid storage droplets surface-binding protein 2 [Harpegnathos saltator]XP_011136937.1 lipid storage droplets surface-binding protein 2 [Harpegnathos saltator]XP_011136938.1 lipid storage droplets surface-binding protein 2 [Harpegnathos saltator]XP_011136939.1 lipid storage droplets surface-binding protein 2 [Harpegnathos saltator]XP_011136940.1 lipid storage droplets surface-binding protein 2 [Harpegnath